MSIERIEAPRHVCGYLQITDLSTAQPLPGNVIDLQAEDGTIRFRLDGVAPTATVGMLIPEGETRRILVGENTLQIISGDGATASVHRYR
ncbi:hypothetical protein K2D_06370 [Planctomycetes bacterium K2D]|uniref:Uncharacterized protein n=1 Tax=Botrimarina mediterranea TaxID=2528022 RepID=A0A518K3Y2_9BACT|nr:hypothetical protein Spa11_06570 [Botrimarina mediterranea]QDV77050.1 hypothetical protein K2D_06370 [Planctomycetes bacterium K2D]